MSEVAALVLLGFGVSVGGVLVWMWMSLREADLNVEVNEAWLAYRRLLVRLVAAETKAAWLSDYVNRISQELEVERIVAESYAAGIQREER